MVYNGLINNNVDIVVDNDSHWENVDVNDYIKGVKQMKDYKNVW